MTDLAVRQPPLLMAQGWFAENIGTLNGGVIAVSGVLVAYFGFRGKRDPAKAKERTGRLISTREFMSGLMTRMESLEKQLLTERSERTSERDTYLRRVGELTEKNAELQSKVAKLEGAQAVAEQMKLLVEQKTAETRGWEEKWSKARDSIHEMVKVVDTHRNHANKLEKLVILYQVELNRSDEAAQKVPRFVTPQVPALSLIDQPDASAITAAVESPKPC